MSYHIIALSGSLRRESYTTKLVRAFEQYAPADYTLALLDTGSLPHINEDLETDLPAVVRDFQATVESADGVLLATPEYNRSYSPVIKNALDWGSRPDGVNVWDGKPTAVIGSSLYSLGAFGAVQHLRQVMMYLNMRPLQQPEFYVADSSTKFDETGLITDEYTIQKITELWAAFARLVKQG